MKKDSLFARIRNKVKPLLTNDDLGFASDFLEIEFFHPDVLPQEINLTIFDNQESIIDLVDSSTLKNDKLNKLKELENPTEDDLKEKDRLKKDIRGLNVELAKKYAIYVENFAKLKPGEFDKKVNDLYSKLENWVVVNTNNAQASEFKEFLKYPKEKFATEVFNEIQEAIKAYNNKELGITEETSEDEKK